MTTDAGSNDAVSNKTSTDNAVTNNAGSHEAAAKEAAGNEKRDRPGGVTDDIVRRIRLRADRLDHGLFGIGIEILPYQLIGVITDDSGGKLAEARVDLLSMEPDAVVGRIAELAQDLVSARLGLDLLSPRLCLGVELGGPVDSETGVVRFYVNGPHDHGKNKPPYVWEEVDLVDRIQKATGCITVVENDAHAHAVYEQKLGVGQHSSSFALVLIRHGVGAGVVLNNQLLPIPAEVGHLTVWHDGRPCDCGMGAHVESRTGRRAIPAVVAEKTGLTSGGSFEWAVSLANGGGPLAGRALEAFTEAGTSVARGIGSILTLFGSPQVVIYGPEALVVEESGASAQAFMAAVRTFPGCSFRHLGDCELSAKPLEEDRGALGAALTALNRHFSLPLEPRLEPVR